MILCFLLDLQKLTLLSCPSPRQVNRRYTTHSHCVDSRVEREPYCFYTCLICVRMIKATLSGISKNQEFLRLCTRRPSIYDYCRVFTEPRKGTHAPYSLGKFWRMESALVYPKLAQFLYLILLSVRLAHRCHTSRPLTLVIAQISWVKGPHSWIVHFVMPRKRLSLRGAELTRANIYSY